MRRGTMPIGLNTEDGFQRRGELIDYARVLFAFLGRHGNKLLALLVVPKSLNQIAQRWTWRRNLHSITKEKQTTSKSELGG